MVVLMSPSLRLNNVSLLYSVVRIFLSSLHVERVCAGGALLFSVLLAFAKFGYVYLPFRLS